MANLKKELCGVPHLDMLFLTKTKKVKDIALAWNEKNSPRNRLFFSRIWWISPPNVTTLSWKFYYSPSIQILAYSPNFSLFELSLAEIDFRGRGPQPTKPSLFKSRKFNIDMTNVFWTSHIYLVLLTYIVSTTFVQKFLDFHSSYDNWDVLENRETCLAPYTYTHLYYIVPTENLWVEFIIYKIIGSFSLI